MPRKVVALGFMLVVLSVCALAEDAAERKVFIKVNGMFCPFCTFGLEKRLKNLPETAEVRTDLAVGEAIVTLKPGAEFVEGNFAEAIKRAGFTHSGIRMRSAKSWLKEKSIGSVGSAPPSEVASAGSVGWRHFKTIGKPGKAVGEFNEPMGIAFASEGWFVVTDAGNARVQQFHPDGSPWRQWSVSGDGNAELLKPVGITVGLQGDIWVSDYEADRINHYGPDGKARGAFGKSGKNPGEFDAPSGIAITSDGLLAVADFYNHRVQLLRPDGDFGRLTRHSRPMASFMWWTGAIVDSRCLPTKGKANEEGNRSRGSARVSCDVQQAS